MIPIYYKNSYGDVLDFTVPSHMMLGTTTLFDYAWAYVTRNESNPRIVQFSKKMIQKEFQLRVCGKDKDDYKTILNNILSTFDYDIVNLKSGRLYVGEYYLDCYVVESKKPKKYVSATCTEIELQILCEEGSWKKSVNFSFVRTLAGSNPIIGDVNNAKDYPYDFRYDYASKFVASEVMNENYSASDFEITIYGECSNPSIYIGGQQYSVQTDLLLGEYLKINSITKKIYKTTVTGQIVNCFNLRQREPYIFKKIPTRLSSVSWDGNFGFDVTLYMSRGEPKWI